MKWKWQKCRETEAEKSSQSGRQAGQVSCRVNNQILIKYVLASLY